MTDHTEAYLSAYKREKKARLEAERLLEEKVRELADKEEELQECYERLRTQQHIMFKNEKLSNLGLISAGIAHEINNPIAFVISNLQTLNRYLDTYQSFYQFLKLKVREHPTAIPVGEVREHMQQHDLDFINADIADLLPETLKGATRIHELVQRFNRFSKANQQKVTEYNLNSSIQSTISMIKTQTKERVNFVLELEELPPIKGNPHELEQAILNLVLNAVYATELVQEPCIRIHTSEANGWIQVQIADNGEGMSEGIMQRLFTPFFTTKPVGQGTGMGLAIVQGIMRKLGGDVLVESRLGQGSTFTLRLPYSLN